MACIGWSWLGQLHWQCGGHGITLTNLPTILEAVFWEDDVVWGRAGQTYNEPTKDVSILWHCWLGTMSIPARYWSGEVMSIEGMVQARIPVYFCNLCCQCNEFLSSLNGLR